MSKSGELIKSTAILAVGKLSTQLIGFFLLPLYTYFLTPAEYGVVDLIVTYFALLVPSLTLQLEMASFRFLVDARHEESGRRSVISNVTYMMIAAISCITICVGVLSLIFDIPYIYNILFAGVAMAVTSLIMQISRGLGDNKQFAVTSIIIGISTAVTAVWFIAIIGMGVEGMLLSMALSNVVGSIYLFSKLKLYRYIKLGQRDMVLQREILGYSVPLVPNGAAWWVINVSDRTIITILIGAAANGIYAVSNKYAAVFMSLFSIFSMSWTESASVHIDAKDRDKFFSDVSNAALRMFGALGLGLIAGIPFIFSIFVNESFGQAYQYVPILVVASFFNAIVGLYSAIYIAKKLTKKVLNTSLVAAGLNIVLTIGLVPFFGLYAAAGATALAFLAMAIFRHYDVKKYVTITYEKHLFIVLALLYTVVIALYYVDNLIASIVGLVIAVVAASVLNKKAVGILKTKALGYLRSRRT